MVMNINLKKKDCLKMERRSFLLVTRSFRDIPDEAKIELVRKMDCQ